MDQDMQKIIDVIEWVCRRRTAAGEPITVDPKVLLDIFAAFRLEIIKARGRNA